MSILVDRNAYFPQEKSILVGPYLNPNYFIEKLNLFPDWTRTFPELDRLIAQIKHQQLHLVDLN